MPSVDLSRYLRCAAELTVIAACLGLFGASPASAETYKATNTTTFEEAVVKANGNSGEANTIELAGGEAYLPTKTQIFTNTHGTTVTGPAGALGVESPEAKVEGTAVSPNSGQGTQKETFVIRSGVPATFKHFILKTGGGSGRAAIEDAGVLTLEDMTISGNNGIGLNIKTSATTTSIVNSTLSDGLLGGVANGSTTGTATFLNDTIYKNGGNGISGTGKLVLTNTIIADNGESATLQCKEEPSSKITNDHSLSSDESCGGTLKNMTPLLGPLRNNGGSTLTHAELKGSPTIDAGDEAACPSKDQRGYARPDVPSTACDIGAYEYSATPPTIKVPEEIVTPATGPGGAEVTYAVSATASYGLIEELNCAPASDSTFPIGPTTVECHATDDSGNTATASFKVNVTATPEVSSVAPTEGSTAGGEAVKVKGSHLAGATEVTFGATKATILPGGSETEVEVMTPAHSAGAVEVCVKTAAATPGCKASAFTYNAPACAASPAIETQPSGQTVTAPAEASFTVVEGAIPANCVAATIQWEVSTNGGASWTPVSGATSATLKIKPTSTSESGHEFRAVLTNGHGSTTSTAVMLTVNAPACVVSPAIETQPSGQTVTAPAEASFTVVEGAIPANCVAATIQWEVSTNGGTSWTPVSGATSAILKIKPTSTSESGHEFRAVLTNGHGSTTSTAVMLTVNAPACAVSPVIETQPSGQTVTAPAEASFTVVEGVIPANCVVATIQWEVSTNGGASWTPVSGATSATLKIKPTSTSESGHEFRVVLTNAHGKTTSTAATLTVNAPACVVSPSIETQPSGQTVTEPAAASFTVKEGAIPANCVAASIQWELSTNGGASFGPITGATSATYTLNPTHTSESGDELRAVLTNAHGKTTSTAATLTVNKTPPATSPEAAIHQLLQEVSSSTIPHGIRHKLSCLLSQALRSLTGLSGHGPSKCGAALLSSKVTKVDRHKSGRPGACEDLQQFIDVIGHDQHSRRPKIPVGLAKTWSKAAHDIEASLSCTSHDKSPGHASQHAHGRRGHRSGGR